MSDARQKISPQQLADRWGIDVHKVLAWIHRGELTAINVAANKRGKPQFRIDERDIELFERNRSAGAARAGKAVATRARTRRHLIPLKRYV
jgi:hypothetical protein